MITRIALPVALGAALLALACGKDSTGTQDVAPPLATQDAGQPPPTAPRRTVGYRNPFGDLSHPDNLVADGDFELTGRSGQMPWQLYANGGQATLDYDTGGACLSGVRCALIGKSQTLIGYFASPATANIQISVHVRSDSGRCLDASIFTVDLVNGQPSSPLYAVQTGPDSTGWCTFSAKALNLADRQSAIDIELAASAKGTQLWVDDALALPVAGNGKNARGSGTPPTGAAVARAGAIAEWIRVHRILGVQPTRTVDDPPPVRVH